MNYRVTLDGRPVDVLTTAVYPAPYNEHKKAEFVCCAGAGGQMLRVVSKEPVKSALIRPLRLGLTAEICKDGLYVFLPKPVNFSLEINGSYDNALLVFYSPERREQMEGDSKVLFFGKGVHEAGVIDISTDNTTVYLEEGAWVNGKLTVHDCTGFTLCGLGVLTEENYNDDTVKDYLRCVDLINCRQAQLRDVTLADSVRWTCRLFGCENVHIDNVKVLGCRGNSDGFDVCGSRNVLIEHCFTRTWDDSLVIKAFDTGDLEHVICRGCTLWNDFARPIEVGVELRADHVRDVLFDDIDVIHSPTGYPVMGIHHGDRAVVSGIMFRNIRIEDVPGAQMFDIRITDSVWNRDDCKGRIENITFENIELIGKPGIDYLPEMSRLQGFDDASDIRHVTFKNIKYLGKDVRSADEMGLLVMDYVSDVCFESENQHPLGHVSADIVFENAILQDDGQYTGTAQAVMTNYSEVPLEGRVWLAVSPVHTAEYADTPIQLCLAPGEKTVLSWPVKLPAGRYVLRLQSDNAAFQAAWTMVTLEWKLGERPVKGCFVNYYNDRLAEVAVSVQNDTLFVAPNVEMNDGTLVVYSAMPAKEFPGEVRFTVEETDFGEAPAVLLGKHGQELAPQLRCPAEITYVFKNEPRVREIRVNEAVFRKGSARPLVFSFEQLGLDKGTKQFWLEFEIKLPETQKYRYPYTLFHSVRPREIAHMFAHVTLD